MTTRIYTDAEIERSGMSASEQLKALADKAIEILGRHIIPDGGVTDAQALDEMYGLFDGPEQRAAFAQFQAEQAV